MKEKLKNLIGIQVHDCLICNCWMRTYHRCRTIENTYYYIMGNDSDSPYYQSSTVECDAERIDYFNEYWEKFSQDPESVPVPNGLGIFDLI